ncbi:MAG: hypothetical protein HC902_08430 [Calothrix sp. SM1_5_4]|nr:hypothetical protein [Calothrix sp. SM1_5_4]
MKSKLFAGVVLTAGLIALSGIDVRWPPQGAAESIWSERAKILKLEAGSGAANVNSDFDIKKLNMAFSGLTEAVSPAVVNIYTKSGVPRGRFRGMPDEDFYFYFDNPFAKPFGGVPRRARPWARDS